MIDVMTVRDLLFPGTRAALSLFLEENPDCQLMDVGLQLAKENELDFWVSTRSEEYPALLKITIARSDEIDSGSYKKTFLPRMMRAMECYRDLYIHPISLERSVI